MVSVQEPHTKKYKGPENIYSKMLNSTKCLWLHPFFGAKQAKKTMILHYNVIKLRAKAVFKHELHRMNLSLLLNLWCRQ
jgi:hypothetical protein